MIRVDLYLVRIKTKASHLALLHITSTLAIVSKWNSFRALVEKKTFGSSNMCNTSHTKMLMDQSPPKSPKNYNQKNCVSWLNADARLSSSPSSSFVNDSFSSSCCLFWKSFNLSSMSPSTPYLMNEARSYNFALPSDTQAKHFHWRVEDSKSKSYAEKFINTRLPTHHNNYHSLLFQLCSVSSCSSSSIAFMR